MQDCIFCKIIKNELDSNIIFEDDNFIVILDRFPVNLGHTLIIPKKHFENIYEIDDNIAQNCFIVVKKISNVLKKTYNLQGINILQNNGQIAFQTVKHFHIHLIPRYFEDNFSLSWNTIKISDEELKKNAFSIKKYI